MLNRYLFTILDTVESTNNYAMGQAHAGLASHGDAWFAREQTNGKGQREKTWESAKNENILMSIALKPTAVMQGKQFYLSALTACVSHKTMAIHVGEQVKIKWPNDLYIGDRKAGGILIENVMKGNEWTWAVVGIGLNVNQTMFNAGSTIATSLKIATGQYVDEIELAIQLQNDLVNAISTFSESDYQDILEYYNEHLYKRNEQVRLKKGSISFSTKVKNVTLSGALITEDSMERSFVTGEVQWIPKNG